MDLSILVRNFTLALVGVLDGLFSIYMLVLLVAILLSWVNADPYNPIVRFVRSATEPLLARVRRALPFVVIGGFDLSPLVVVLGLQFLRTFLVASLAEFALRMSAASGALPVG
jgi:YggT family protein